MPDKYAPQKRWKKKNPEKVRNYNKEYARRWRKLHPSRTKTINTRQKIKERHGEIGLFFLNHSNGLCSKCGKKCLDPITLQGFNEKKGQTSWHLHDIDFDRNNQIISNFCLLCFDCHIKFHQFFIKAVPKELKIALFKKWLES